MCVCAFHGSEYCLVHYYTVDILQDTDKRLASIFALGRDMYFFCSVL